MDSTRTKFSVAEFAKYLDPPISRQRVNEFVNRNELVRGKDSKIDITDPKNRAWLQARRTAPPPPKPPGRWGDTRNPTGASDDEDDFADVDAEDVLAHMATLDVRRFRKADIDKLRNLESLLKIRVEREHKRRELIERSLVQTVFARLYQIESSQLRVLGARLAPAICGLLGSDDSEQMLLVEHIVDNEIMKVLSHVKRMVHESLVKFGADGLPND